MPLPIAAVVLLWFIFVGSAVYTRCTMYKDFVLYFLGDQGIRGTEKTVQAKQRFLQGSYFNHSGKVCVLINKN